jgi:ubiquinone/menaquinone biosynthesis C-methylase UbiE
MVAVPDPHPNLETVWQPGLTEFEAPPNFKARIKESYDARADQFNVWTTTQNVQLRIHYVGELIKLLKGEDKKKGAAHGRDDKNKAGAHKYDDKSKVAARPLMRSSSRSGTGAAGAPAGLWGMHALDVGCGCGHPVLQMLVDEDIDTIGVDLSARQIAQASERFPRQIKSLQVVLAEQDMMDLRFPPAEFNMVVALFTLMHLERAEQTVFLNRAHRWLKPGGMLLFNFPQVENEGRVLDQWHGKEAGWLFTSSWGQSMMMEVIHRLDFEVLVEEVRGDGGVEVPNVVWVIAQKRKPPMEPKKEWVQRPREPSVGEAILLETPMTALSMMTPSDLGDEYY